MKTARPDSLSAGLLLPLCFFFFFKVVINKNPCERWLYSRDWAEGMEFITLFDWVTPRLSSRSKQLLDFHSPRDLLLLPFLCSPLHKTPLLLLPPDPASFPPNSLSLWHPSLLVLFVFLCRLFLQLCDLTRLSFLPVRCLSTWPHVAHINGYVFWVIFFKSCVACLELKTWWKLL